MQLAWDSKNPRNDIESPYTLIIQWSGEDVAFAVSVPEWRDRVINPVTYDDTYEQAAAKAREVLELLIEATLDNGEALPELEPLASIR